MQRCQLPTTRKFAFSCTVGSMVRRIRIACLVLPILRMKPNHDFFASAEPSAGSRGAASDGPSGGHLPRPPPPATGCAGQGRFSVSFGRVILEVTYPLRVPDRRPADGYYPPKEWVRISPTLSVCPAKFSRGFQGFRINGVN